MYTSYLDEFTGETPLYLGVFRKGVGAFLSAIAELGERKSYTSPGYQFYSPSSGI